MIGLNAIRDAIILKLKTAYPDHNIYGEEIQQGYKRPAFYIQLIPEQGLIINAVHREKNLLIDICYFSNAGKPFRDIWNITDELEILLGSGLAVDDRVFYINDPQPEIVDGVLHYQFKLQFTDSLDGIIVNLDKTGETVTIPSNPRQTAEGYTEGEILPMRELEIKEEL